MALHAAVTAASSRISQAARWLVLQVASPSGGQSRRIRVVNMSFSGYADPTSSDYQATLDIFCAPFRDANAAGVAIFAAAGNYGMSYRGKYVKHCRLPLPRVVHCITSPGFM
jgi:subtilisin family serine protease